jgi:hypothetical protein
MFVVGFFRNIAGQAIPEHQQIISIVISGVSLLLLITGFICGIVGLFGIRKYGPRRLLVRSILGILVPIGLVLLAIPTFLYAIEAARQQNS